MRKRLTPKMKKLLDEITRLQGLQWATGLQAHGMKEFSLFGSVLIAPTAPFDVFLQYRFGDGHLTVARAWGFWYTLWFWLGWSQQNSDTWQFWPTLGLIAAVLMWIHRPFSLSPQRDWFRSSGVGYSIIWRFLMIFLSFFSLGIRIQLYCPAKRTKLFRVMDWAFVLIVNWYISYLFIQWALATHPAPDWLATTLQTALAYMGIRNLLLMIYIPLTTTDIFATKEVLQQRQDSLLAELFEQTSTRFSNKEAEAAMQLKHEQSNAGIKRPREAASRVAANTRAPDSRPESRAETPAPPPTNSRYCGKCGHETQGTNFCTNCGQHIGETDG